MVMLRKGRGDYSGGVRGAHPSRYAYSQRFPFSVGAVAPDDPALAMGCAIKCAQCGAPIEDYRVLQFCWGCGSDNFLGLRF